MSIFEAYGAFKSNLHQKGGKYFHGRVISLGGTSFILKAHVAIHTKRNKKDNTKVYLIKWMIQIKCHDLFSIKNKKRKNLECRLMQL